MSNKNRKPIDVLLAEGKTHLTKSEIEERREKENAIRPNSDKIKCPSWVKDKVARSEYKRLSEELQELNLLTNLDVNTLASYAVAFSLYQKATQELEGQSLLINESANPLIRIQLLYSDECKKYAIQMGLTISSRLKLVVPKPSDDKPKNKFGDFVNE
ncbi:phage terminase small subunit P27 family [Paenibacillus sp. Root444D2]|uniref:phage terminase small subunit P27 family n=1 Tax=Paenibacillus sp. Root444D2 TaxID=1736538 RepID=UPI000708E37D|nr:phage terminase small subunit P27 family [Paenibacillus sp. Root444D2]KQX69239.1 hypothetical protein ASD40_01695 [Paenibacillus sp. Root444D2]